MEPRYRSVFEHAGVTLVRATTLPSGLALPKGLDLSTDAGLEAATAWLVRTWSREDVQHAVNVASPILASQMDMVLHASQSETRRVRRMVLSLAAYALRWQGRATPFGLFAGTATVRIDEQPEVRWGTDHRVVAQADSAWLGVLVRRLERHPLLRESLSVVSNRCAFIRGACLVVPGQPPDNGPDVVAPMEISVRYTRAVRHAMEAADKPIRFGELTSVLAEHHPATPRERITAMLGELVAHRFLLTNLPAPATVPDALAHLRSRLDAAGVQAIPDLAGLDRELRTIHRRLSAHNRSASASTAAATRGIVADRMRAVCDAVSQPLHIDVGLDCRITVPTAVISEAEVAATTLLRLTPYPFGRPEWKEFHSRFRRRYGPGAVVAVSELVSDAGLGFPDGYLGAAMNRHPPTLTDRDRKLLALVEEAVLVRSDEIELTDSTLRSLTVGDPAEMLWPPRVELAFQIHAASLDALRHGAFRLMVTGTPRLGSSMAGRFANLLPAADREHLSSSYAVLSTDGPDAVAAQLLFSPRRRHSENVVRTPRLLPKAIALAEYHDTEHDRIELDDLAVGADARQMYLLQVSTGRRVEPRVLHALDASVLTPPLARFLAEVTTARCASYRAFDWGAADRLPYLPRLRHGRVVLSPARWMLAASSLPPRRGSVADWDANLEAWRHRLGVPGAVVVCEGDLRLPLDLDDPLHRAVLRTRLDRVGEVELREAPLATDLAWIGRAHEFLIPLRRTTRPGSVRHARRTIRATQRSGHLPGNSAWLHVQIPSHPDRQNEILTDHLPRLIDDWGGDPPVWWFGRHHDVPGYDLGQHLALYLRLRSADLYGAAAARVGDWAANMSLCGLVPQIQLATYHPEIGRYGHGPAVAVAEKVFAADSAAALAQIELVARTGTPAEAVTAAGMVDLAMSYTGVSREGLCWLIDHLPRLVGRLDQSARNAALQLADPRGDWATLRAMAGGGQVLSAWRRRQSALVTYRDHLAHQQDPLSVLRSLLHTHHVRTIGIDSAREAVSHGLARAAALHLTVVGHGDSR